MTPSAEELLNWDTAAAPTISTALIFLKQYLPKKFTHFLPLVAIGLGITYALTARPGCHLDPSCAVAGMQVGLIAVGLHSSIKSAAERHKKPPTL
jgi:hypothetical protein